MNRDAKLDRHTVRCHGCGKQVTDLKRTRTQIRKELDRQGWRVAMPLRCTVSIQDITPEMNRKTVDRCRECNEAGIERLCKDVSEIWARLDLEADRLCSDKVQ